MKYEGIVYRPPSEARSLIVQVTIGCAHNTCTFCNMYKAKDFRVRSMDEIMEIRTEEAKKDDGKDPDAGSDGDKDGNDPGDKDPKV